CSTVHSDSKPAASAARARVTRPSCRANGPVLAKARPNFMPADCHGGRIAGSPDGHAEPPLAGPGFAPISGGYHTTMITLGIVLLILGALLAVPLLWTIGIVLVVV